MEDFCYDDDVDLEGGHLGGENNETGPTSPKSTANKKVTEADNEQAQASLPPPDKKEKVKRDARAPTSGELWFSTGHYKLYDPGEKNVGFHREKPHREFDNYDTYTLIMNPNYKDASEVPNRGVRLDDLTIALVSGKFTSKELHSAWKAEFGANGMVRTARVPLGHAAKVFKTEGDVDVDGYVLKKEDEGWYYLWHKGLHLLCGEEGLKANIYMVRPSREKPRGDGSLGFKRGFKAVVQLAPGHRDDPTFKGLMPEFAMLSK